MRLYLDTETKGPRPRALDDLGLYNCARHPDSRILLLSYAIDDESECVVDLHHKQPLPADFLDAARDPKVEVVAHNAIYDRVWISSRKLLEPWGIEIAYARWHCTAARARVHGLPGDLETLSKIYRLGDDGKQDGKELIQLFCEKGADPDEHIAEWLRFMDYSRADITSLRRLYKLLPAWEWTERQKRMYALDQRINDRGFAVDLKLAQAMIETSDQAKASLDARVAALTEGKIAKATQRAAVQAWIKEDGLVGGAGFELVDMKAETLRKALREHKAGRIDLTPSQIELIELRLLTSKSSTAKCKTAQLLAGPDSRIRGAITFNGGGRIGRFSHKGFQPGNLPRPDKQFEDKELVAMATAAILDGSAFTIWGDAALSVCANVLRGLIVAAPGKKLIDADYSNIEGRVLAWFAGEDWKLEAYERGADMYKLLGSRMTGLPQAEIVGVLRSRFKTCELFMGYEGSVGAYLNGANSVGLDLVELAATASQSVAPEFMASAARSWEWAVANSETHDLPRDIYVACAAYRDMWRAGSPATVALWENLLNCAKTAVKHPGQTFACADGKVAMKASVEWLAVQIPSGRKIMFAKPRIETKPLKNKDGTPKLDAQGNPVLRTQLTALKSPEWVRESLYGGLLANAITQGLSRDILVDAMLDVDAAGFPIVLHVHDEIDAEIDDSDPRTHEDMIAIMLRQAAKYPGLPLAAAGFTAKRYRKG